MRRLCLSDIAINTWVDMLIKSINHLKLFCRFVQSPFRKNEVLICSKGVCATTTSNAYPQSRGITYVNQAFDNTLIRVLVAFILQTSNHISVGNQ